MTKSNDVYLPGMSLAEMEAAVKELTPEELAKLAAFIAREDKLSWDLQIEDDFSPDGKHATALKKIDTEIDAGALPNAEVGMRSEKSLAASVHLAEKEGRQS